MAKIIGAKIIAPLIKNKTYRKNLTDFIDTLRKSSTFRDRQMYLVVAKATFKADNEIFKKHFAKSMGIDMMNEKVNAVRIMMAKLVAKVPKGYSKSTDKLCEMLQKSCKSGEVKQYLAKENNKDNEALGHRRFIST
jgi:hypothetical protein